MANYLVRVIGLRSFTSPYRSMINEIRGALAEGEASPERSAA
jgi:hypothetical protein